MEVVEVVCNEQQQHYTFTSNPEQLFQARPPHMVLVTVLVTQWADLLISNEFAGQYVEVVVLVVGIDHTRCDVCWPDPKLIGSTYR